LDVTTSDQAREFCAHVIAREPYRLAMLARWMDGTGGPIASMDGSVDSLLPLWSWFLQFIQDDLPGVDEDVLPSSWPTPTGFEDDGPGVAESLSRERRIAYVSESLAHYVRMVIERDTGRAWWEPLLSFASGARPDRMHHSPVVVYDGGFVYAGFTTRLALIAERRGDFSRVDMARDTLLRDYAPRGRAVPGGPSLLEPFLTKAPSRRAARGARVSRGVVVHALVARGVPRPAAEPSGPAGCRAARRAARRDDPGRRSR
jgi:hypothetical protein